MSIRLEKDGAVGRIILDRPPANTYDVELLRAFGSAVDDARVDEDVHAVLVESASPRFFSAGADVAVFKEASVRRRAMTVLIAHEVFRKLEQTPLLFVAAISGHCLGGGFELALACDLRFAAAGDYRLGLPETSLGLLPGSGGTQRLPRLIGQSRALDLIASARTITPQEALELGAVDRLLDSPEACHQAALDYCHQVAAGAAESIGRAKLAVSLGTGVSLDAGLALEREAMVRVFETHDADEGIAAFLEKRPPHFEGR
ncbi:MAG: enoyl-CoA hydratase-related protein [Candidatus Dormiibacterota bacterium]